MNSLILPTSKASIASSSRATWTDAIRGTFVPSDDRVIASSAPTVKRSSWIFDSRSRMRRSRCAAMARPMTALSSSTVPIASTRGSSFETRSGPRRPVSPASPRRVYSFAITSPAPPHLGGLEGAELLPGRARAVEPARDSDHLRYPVATEEQRIEPLQAHGLGARDRGRCALRHPVDALLEDGDDF